MQKTLEILREINDIPLVSTREEVFIRVLEEKIKNWLPDYTIKNIENNIIALPKTAKTTNVLFIHVDEIGFLVKRQLSKNTYELQISGLVDKVAAHGLKVQTVINGKKYLGVIGNVLPHSKKTTEELIVEFLEDVDLPALWPIQFYNDLLISEKYIFSKTMDNRLGVAAVIKNAMEKPLCFVLTSGEEEGTQRFNKVLEELQIINFENIIVFDSAPSNQDVYYKDKTMIDEGKLGIIPIEGGGSGNEVPEDLLQKTKDLLMCNSIEYNIVQTHFADEITDATCLFKMGIKSIAICYPLRYLHSPFEVVNKKTIELLDTLLRVL